MEEGEGFITVLDACPFCFQQLGLQSWARLYAVRKLHERVGMGPSTKTGSSSQL